LWRSFSLNDKVTSASQSYDAAVEALEAHCGLAIAQFMKWL
jgi:hypothetical protein